MIVKKKIGFLDRYIDEWHANEYPKLLANSSWKDEFEVAYAYEEIPADGKRDLRKWCGDNHVEAVSSIEEIVEKSDVIVLLSPGWPEFHERLSQVPLSSGKPVYIDKPMADSYAAAARMFAMADKHHTPVTSSSALRFGSQFQSQREGWKGNPVQFASVRGGGVIRGFVNYGIHQIELLVMALGTGASRVMQVYGKDSEIDLMLIDYPDGRRGVLNRMPNLGFELTGRCQDKAEFKASDFNDCFPRMIDNMMRFFATCESSIPRSETLEAMRIFEAGIKALETPGVWVDCPR